MFNYVSTCLKTIFITFWYFYKERMSASIIAIGNPGAGKSTILNSLAGEILFKSGIYFGTALTCQLEERMNERGRFYDTPGLADDTLREAAGKAISTALRKGGPFKILFFVGLKSGRIIRNDITTIKLVLDSAPEIENRYGIVINKLPSEVSEILKDPNQAEKLLIKMFTSIPEEKRCPLTSITYLPYRPEADSKNNYLLRSNSLKTPEDSSFADFVKEKIETVQLTEGLAKAIKIRSFEETTKIIQVLEKKLEENKEIYKEQQRWTFDQLENADMGVKMSDGSNGRMYTSKSRQFHNPEGYNSEEFSSTEKSSNRIQSPMYPRRMETSILAVGNPGAGKSTILNSLAGDVLFKSGISIGTGLTYELEEAVNDRGRFYDTPGLSDEKYRKAAAIAISTALRKGGPFKILFFMRLQAGRIVLEDKATFKLVLNSAPEMENKYGIVTNIISKNMAKRLEDPELAQTLLTYLFNGIPEEKRCAASSITYLPSKPEAHDEDNVLLDLDSLKTLSGFHFKDFVYGQVPTVELTPGIAKDIEIKDFENMTKLIAMLEQKMKDDQQMFQEQKSMLLQQLEKAEEDKKKDREMSRLQMDLLKSSHEHERNYYQRKQEQMAETRESQNENKCKFM